MDLDVYGGSSKTMTTLRHSAVRGVKWSAISRAGRLGTQFITTIILARLLSPEDFGLVGMAVIVIGFLGIFKDMGTSAAIIQRERIDDSLISSIFWVNIVFGLFVTFLLFAGASVIAWFYHESRLTPLMRALSFSFLLSGFGIVPNALMQRALAFKKLAKIELTAIISGSIVGIVLAFSGVGVWSLVIQSLTTAGLTTILLWLLGKWRPKLKFNWQEVKSISGYSLNLTGFNLLNYLARNADYLLIGRYLGATALGLYTLAYQILLFPVQSISAVIGRVMFPVYSKIQSDNKRFSRIYLDVASTIALFTFPLMTGLFLLAKPFISVTLGPKWQQVALLIQILAPVGAVQSIATTVGLIYQAKGKTDWLFRWGIFSVSVIIIAFIIGIQYGIVGVATAYGIIIFMITYPNFAIPFRLIELQFTDLLQVLKIHILNSAIMATAILIVWRLLPPFISDSLLLAILIPIGMLAYFTSVYYTNRSQLTEILSQIKLLV